MSYRTIIERVAGDTHTPLGATLTINGSKDLSAYSAVQFRMVNDAGAVIVDWTPATFVDKPTGKVQFDFQAAHVATAGVYWAWFRVGDGAEWVTLPAGGAGLQARTFKIILNATT